MQGKLMRLIQLLYDLNHNVAMPSLPEFGKYDSQTRCRKAKSKKCVLFNIFISKEL